MRGMILAAGRGARMGALTKEVPKPLLRIRDQYLIDYAIRGFVRAGICEIVINISYFAEQIKTAVGNGKRYGALIRYSEEKERLETGGGIFHALSLLGDHPFVVMSSDIITDFPLETLLSGPTELAHLIMVANPAFNPQGDFGMCEGYASMDAKPTLTYASLGVFKPQLFKGCQPGSFKLNQLLFPAIKNKLVTAEPFSGTWYNIGTPAQLDDCQLTLPTTS